MGRYVLQMEDLWQGEWLAIGTAATIDADSPADALARIESIPLRAGVTYRVHVSGSGADVRTAPARAPELPELDPSA